MTKKQATAKARALRKRLGRGWKIRVWENLGWHYGVINDVLSVSTSEATFGRAHFYAFLGEADNPGGYWVGEGTTPKKAIDEAIKVGTRHVIHRRSIVNAALDIVNPKGPKL